MDRVHRQPAMDKVADILPSHSHSHARARAPSSHTLTQRLDVMQSKMAKKVAAMAAFALLFVFTIVYFFHEDDTIRGPRRKAVIHHQQSNAKSGNILDVNENAEAEPWTGRDLFDSYFQAVYNLNSAFTKALSIVPDVATTKYIPKNILQTAASKSVFLESSSWDLNGEGFNIIRSDDADNLAFVKEHMSQAVVDAYIAMPKVILQVDYYRYIALYVKGGIYSDKDTDALKDLSSWLPIDDNPKRLSYNKALDQSTGKFNSKIGLIVAVEADGTLKSEYYLWFARKIQFSQWTIAAKPGHPALKMLIDRIAKNNDYWNAESRGENFNIMSWTGPGIFTDVVMDYINIIQSNLPEDKQLKLSDLYALDESILVGDVLILPITSFNPSATYMGARGIHDALAFVSHHYEHSWVND